MTIGIYKDKSYYKLERYDMNSKYIIDTAENKEFLKENALSLLKFGRKFPSPNGSSYYLGDDGTPWTDRPRETWITSRMAHDGDRRM